MDSTERAAQWLCNPQAEVSAHYLISPKGHVIQMVREEDRAWHAGAGAWGAVTDVNSHSIGIELSNTGSQPFAAPQMAALEQLLPGIMTRWRIRPQGVIAHSDAAPGRKIDPGRRFDWARLARAGLSVWPHLSACLQGDFYSDAAVFGYRGAPEVVLESFRQRFRPAASGPLCSQDIAVMADLAARFAVDREGDWA